MKKLLLASAISLGVAACGSSDDNGEATIMETPEETAEAAAAPAEAVESITEAATQATSGDPIRGPGGLEEKCLERVASETGANVIGTNRIDEAESGIAIYVNVEGATAPWRCFGYSDGTIDGVMFAGDEGAL